MQLSKTCPPFSLIIIFDSSANNFYIYLNASTDVNLAARPFNSEIFF